MQSPYLAALSLMLLATFTLGRRTLHSRGFNQESLKAVINQQNLTADKTNMTAGTTGHGLGAVAASPHHETSFLSLNLEFNTRIFGGESPASPANIDLLTACVEAANADVIALQEAVDYPDKMKSDPVMQALDKVGYTEVVSTTSGTDGKREATALSFEGMIYGNPKEPQTLITEIKDERQPSFVKDHLTDSKYPLVNKIYVKKSIINSVKSKGSVLVSPEGKVTFWPEEVTKKEPTALAPRFLAYAEIDFGGKSVYFLSTHYTGGRFEDTDFVIATEYRAKQSEAITKWAAQNNAVLVGDFNAAQDFALKKAAFLLKYANDIPVFAHEKAKSNEDNAIQLYDQYMTSPMDALSKSGWSTTTDLKWSSKGKFASEKTREGPVFTSKFNTVVDHVFWRGEVDVKSIEVLWALAFAVNEKGMSKPGKNDMDTTNGFTDHNGVLVTIDLGAKPAMSRQGAASKVL